MSIIGIWPRSFCKMLIHLWPCLGIGAEYPGQSLPTYSSMAESKHRLQLVHSATSLIMFHFFLASLRRYQMRFLERALDFLVLLHRREHRRHVLDAAVPQLDLHQRVGAGERVGGFGLGALRREQG